VVAAVALTGATTENVVAKSTIRPSADNTRRAVPLVKAPPLLIRTEMTLTAPQLSKGDLAHCFVFDQPLREKNHCVVRGSCQVYVDFLCERGDRDIRPLAKIRFVVSRCSDSRVKDRGDVHVQRREWASRTSSKLETQFCARLRSRSIAATTNQRFLMIRDYDQSCRRACDVFSARSVLDRTWRSTRDVVKSG
jgi:hypothetical protein